MQFAFSAAVFLVPMAIAASSGNLEHRELNSNSGLQAKSAHAACPDGYTLDGDVTYSKAANQKETSGPVVGLVSGRDQNGDGARAGSLSQTVASISPSQGRWFRFRIRGLAQNGFHVQRDELFLKVEFFRDGGKNSLDHVKKLIYPQVARERDDFRDKATNASLGSGIWRSYELDFRTPFPEVDTLRLSAGFDRGAGKSSRSEFLIGEFTLTQILAPEDYVARIKTRSAAAPAASKSLVALGGRWFYDPAGGSATPPRRFDHTNVDRLYYRTDRLEAPFADNVSAWLRKGYLDRNGDLVNKDRFVADAVTLTFTGSDLVVHSHNLPNHPTAVFPDRWRALDGNPNYIQEQSQTWHIPLEPQVNPDHEAVNEGNANGALPGGPIGIACNGVVFFNPFDADSVEAIWRLDRCCGHPSPMYEYHYHKYPACVKSPWCDDGEKHSPLIGFAFDGFPVYGPYEAAGELAKDSRKNPLNAFNLHFDEERGWHYHVTPGKFPHLIGGYWGMVDSRNRPRHPPR